MQMFQLFNWNPNPLEPKEHMRQDDFYRGLQSLNIRMEPSELDKLWKVSSLCTVLTAATPHLTVNLFASSCSLLNRSSPRC